MKNYLLSLLCISGAMFAGSHYSSNGMVKAGMGDKSHFWKEQEQTAQKEAQSHHEQAHAMAEKKWLKPKQGGEHTSMWAKPMAKKEEHGMKSMMHGGKMQAKQGEYAGMKKGMYRKEGAWVDKKDAWNNDYDDNDDDDDDNDDDDDDDDDDELEIEELDVVLGDSDED